MMIRILAVLFCLFLLSIGEAHAYVPGAGLARSRSGGETKTGTITTIRSPITRNVKVYRKSNVRSVKGSRGVTKITTTTTTTVTTLTKRVTVIKRVLTKAAKPTKKKKT